MRRRFQITFLLIGCLLSLVARQAHAQFDFGRIVNRARQAVQPRSSNRVRPAVMPQIRAELGRQLERAAIDELERHAPQVIRIIRDATGGGRAVDPPIHVHPVEPIDPPRRPSPRPNPQPRPEPQPELDLDSLPAVSEGQEVALEAADLGAKPGRVLVKFQGLTLKAKILEWQKKQALIQLPTLGVEEPALAIIQIVLADGKPAESLPVKFEPAPEETTDETTTDAEEVVAEELPAVTAGEELALDGEELGEKTGIVSLTVGRLTLKAKILQWTNEAVNVQMPALPLDEAAVADLKIIRADGEIASSIKVRFEPAAQTADK